MSIIDKINDQQEMLMTKRKLKIYHFSNLDKHMEEGPCTKNSDSIYFLRKTNTHVRFIKRMAYYNDRHCSKNYAFAKDRTTLIVI